jgi:hypothetical protein
MKEGDNIRKEGDKKRRRIIRRKMMISRKGTIRREWII